MSKISGWIDKQGDQETLGHCRLPLNRKMHEHKDVLHAENRQGRSLVVLHHYLCLYTCNSDIHIWIKPGGEQSPPLKSSKNKTWLTEHGKKHDMIYRLMDPDPEEFTGTGHWPVTCFQLTPKIIQKVRSLSFATVVLHHFQVCFCFDTKECVPLSHAYKKIVLSRGARVEGLIGCLY